MEQISQLRPVRCVSISCLAGPLWYFALLFLCLDSGNFDGSWAMRSFTPCCSAPGQAARLSPHQQANVFRAFFGSIVPCRKGQLFSQRPCCAVTDGYLPSTLGVTRRKREAAVKPINLAVR